MGIQYDCCDKEIECEVHNNIPLAKVPEDSYYISIKRGKDNIGLDICKDCIKKFIKNKKLEIK